MNLVSGTHEEGSRTYTVTFVCQPGDLEQKACLLAASLSRHLRLAGELVVGLPLPPGEWRRALPLSLPFLESLGVRPVFIRNELDHRYPIGQKLSCFSVPVSTTKRIFLDSDILCLRELRDQPRFSVPFNAKPADRATFSADRADWDAVFAAMGVASPRLHVHSTLRGEPMPPYFNAGVLIADSGTGLEKEWLSCCRTIDDMAHLPHRRPHLDQIGLAVAVQRLGLDFDALDDSYNFPGHRKRLGPAEPYLLHYHDPEVIGAEPAARRLVRSLADEHSGLASLLRRDPEWAGLLEPTKLRSRATVGATGPAAPPAELVITGIPRSGTSYVCSLLHDYDNCVVVNEPQAVFRSLREEPVPWGVGRLYRDLRAAVAQGDPIENKLDGGRVVEDTAGSDVRTLYVPEVTDTDFVLGTKNTLAYLARLRPLRRALPNARFVACVRNPFDTIASWKRSFAHLRDAAVHSIPVGSDDDPMLSDHQRRQLRGIGSLDGAAERRAAWWRYLAEAILAEADWLTIVRYEQLVGDPTGVVESILDGLPAGSCRTSSAVPAPRPRYSHLLDIDDVRAVRALCGQSAAELGVAEPWLSAPG